MIKRPNQFVSVVLFAGAVCLYPSSQVFSFNLNNMLDSLPKLDAPSNADPQPRENKENNTNPLGAIFGGNQGLPFSSMETKSKNKSGSSLAGMICSDFRKKNPAVLYGSSAAGISALERSVSADLDMTIDDAKRLLQDQYENLEGARWLYHFKANYSDSFTNESVRATFVEYNQKPEMRLEMAARLKKASDDSSLEEEVRAEARFAYALVLARFQHVHKKLDLIDGLLNSAYEADNVGATYVKALRLYKGYGIKKDVNFSAEISKQASDRMEELNEKAEEYNEDPLEWSAPDTLMVLNLTDKEFRGHQSWTQLAAKAGQVRRSIEESLKGKKIPALRRQADKLSESFDQEKAKLAEIFNISGKVAAERLKFQTAKARLDQNQQILETKIAVDRSTSKLIEDAIGTADAGLRPEAEKMAKEIRSKFDGLASRSFALMGTMLMNFSLSEDLLFSMKIASRMSGDGCRFVYAMDSYFERANVAFSEEEKIAMGSQAKSDLEDMIPPDDGK